MNSSSSAQAVGGGDSTGARAWDAVYASWFKNYKNAEFDADARDPYRIEGPFEHPATGKKHFVAYKLGKEEWCDTNKTQFFAESDEVSGLVEILGPERAKLMLTKWVWEKNGYVVPTADVEE